MSARGSNRPPRLAILAAGLCVVGAGCGRSPACPVLPPMGAMATTQLGTSHERVRVIVVPPSMADLRAIRGAPRHVRRRSVPQALADHAARTVPALRALLEQRGGENIVPLPIIGGVAATVPASRVAELAALPGIGSVRLDSILRAPRTLQGSPAAPEWNVEAIRAPELWNLGVRGSGVVVAMLDTGADVNHVDLAGGWRGGTNSWFDPFRSTAAPYDVDGHGTSVLGIIVGGGAGGTRIGAAPDAKWIAAKIYDDARATSESIIHQAFAWVLDPDGKPETTDAPDVVNASWGVDSAGACDARFLQDVEALRAADILVVFAAGNSGPGAPSDFSPANYAGSFSAGAVDESNRVWTYSSRGPSACTHGIFPDVMAPGVDVWTSDLSAAGISTYRRVSGTSFAAAHVAGAAALLFSGVPNPTAALVSSALRTTARDIGPLGPENADGNGLIDAYAAYASLTGTRAFRVITASLPAGTVAVVYEQHLDAGDGVAPYRWSVVSGALPPGLQLDPANGTIAGQPVSPGPFVFTVRVQDASSATSDQRLELDVLANSCHG